MARQTSLIRFTGKLGHLIGYECNGRQLLRSMPEKVRQTAATCRAAQRFGRASKRGALIRHALYSNLDVRCDSTHINRMTCTLIPSAGNDMAALHGFHFNQAASVAQFFTITPVVSGDNTLHIPPQRFPVYKGISAIEIKIIATRVNVATEIMESSTLTVIVIDTAVAFEGAIIPLQAAGTGILMVTLQVRGLCEGQFAGNRKYLAADIIAVIPPQPAICHDMPETSSAVIITPEPQDYVIMSNTPVAVSFVQRE